MPFQKIAYKHFLFSTVFTLGFIHLIFAQEVEKKESNFEFSAFIGGYYGYDFNQPREKKRLPFLFNHTRSDQFAINLALVEGKYERGWVRANLGIQQGTYAQDNYSAEPKALRWLNQANVGFALNQSKTIWLDAGLLPSHIGFASAVSTENMTLSRSLIAENSPYFLTGARLGWQKDEQLYISFWITRGWQVIQGVSGNSIPSIGTQVNYASSERLTLNWSTLIGNNYPDEFRKWRYFSNHYITYQFGSNWNLIAGIDLGWEQTAVNSKNLNFWSGGSLILGFELNENWAAAFRGEYYSDPEGVIARNELEAGLKTSGISLNLDRDLPGGFTIRVESRYLFGRSNQYLKQGRAKNDNLFLLSAITWQWN